MTDDQTTTEPLSGPDNAWRKMGEATNLTTITGVLIFEEPVGYEAFRDRLQERLLRFDRFRQRVGARNRQVRRPYWEPSPEFDIEAHVTHVALPEPQSKAAFERFVGGLLSRPLDERRPLWECYLVDGVGDGNGWSSSRCRSASRRSRSASGSSPSGWTNRPPGWRPSSCTSRSPSPATSPTRSSSGSSGSSRTRRRRSSRTCRGRSTPSSSPGPRCQTSCSGRRRPTTSGSR